MKMRNMIAAIAAMAVSAVCVAAVPVSAADVTIAYTESAGSLSKGDDGVSLRRNIYNVWGNDVKDIDGPATTVIDHVTVTFNVSGIGSDSVKTNEDQSTEPLYVFLGGSIAGTSYHQSEYDGGSVPAGQSVSINGDGEYSVTWADVNSENIDCLYLQSNINFYAYGENVKDVADTTANISVVSIVTGEKEEETTTAESTTTAAETTTTAAGETTTGSGSTTAAGSTTTKSASTTAAAAGGNSSASASTTAAASTTNTATGETNGIVVAAVALTLAGGVALVSRKRK